MKISPHEVYEHVKMVTNDAGTDVYHVTRHACPDCECAIYTCSCPNFQMGIVRQGENPFAKPCKHVRFVIENEPDEYLEGIMKGVDPEW